MFRMTQYMQELVTPGPMRMRPGFGQTGDVPFPGELSHDQAMGVLVVHARKHLAAWGGNSSGLAVGNIDTQCRMHPHTYWSDRTVGSLKTDAFSALWSLCVSRGVWWQHPYPRAAGRRRSVGRVRPSDRQTV